MRELPGFQDFMRPLLELLAGEAAPLRAREVYEKLADRMKLDADERGQLLPSRKQPTYRNRIGWASTYLRFAGLVQSPTRGIWTITDAGRKLLAKNKGRIDLRVLQTIPAYVEARRAAEGEEGDSANEAATVPSLPSEETPEELLFAAHKRIVGSVAEQLSELLQQATPDFFEELVVDLLGRMGYGTSDDARVRVGRSGDGGIDGVISLDKLGLEKVYIQAKKWAPGNKVGRPDVQAFFGALAGQRATKGLFMTTSAFSKEAEQYAASVSGSLILVDGKRLVQLMIDHGLGVSTAHTLLVPRIDHDGRRGGRGPPPSRPGRGGRQRG